ncbi:MAG: hypothetical protein JKY70_01765 [Mucilaginibacter sp.]|nr:hypothetical protein [Mucilaginibacter sp.]
MNASFASSAIAGSTLELGVVGHPLGDAPYIATSATKQIQLIKSMGMKWYRINVITQSDGTVTVPSLLQPLLDAASKGGVKILPMLHPRTMDITDDESESYARGWKLGKDFAAKYGKYFAYYDLGNDLDFETLIPNKTGRSQTHYEYEPTRSIMAYLKGMDEGIKSIVPTAKTMISAGWLHYAFLRMCFWYGIKYDIVGYHWYSDMENAAPNPPNNIPDITQKLSSLFPNKPIWITEFNYRYKTTRTTAENEAAQRDFINSFVKKCSANPQVKVAIVYELFDEPYKSVQESTYGIAKWLTPYTLFKNKPIIDYLLK